jgi:RsiW-degrading membrane proteinase PrsW (M82 family)
VAAAALAVTLFFWYGLEFVHRRIHPRRSRTPVDDDRGTEATIEDRIDHVLTEARTILPGAQALLGFQLITMLSEAFERLPASSRYIHFSSLLSIALSTVLLLTPAAYHRIVEGGEDTERFHRFASRVLLFATIPLALGLAGDFFVVVRKLTSNVTWSVVGAVLVLAVSYGLWFGLTSVLRFTRRRKDVHARAV